MYPVDPAPTSAAQAITDAQVCLRVAIIGAGAVENEAWISRAIRLLNWASHR